MSVVVVGDVMLDLFEEGRVDRISPEAPVPILQNPRGHDVLGGAANTAHNILSLGSPTTLVGLVGEDQAGERCRVLAGEANLKDGLVTVPGWRTVVKHRFMSGGQQILRVDTEVPPPDGAADLLLDGLRDAVCNAEAVVLSDYDKGAVSDSVAREVIAEAHGAGIPVIVDSKRLDPRVFSGCAIIAPNHLEATRMTGSSDPEQAAAQIAGMTHSAVLVTLGADGMLLYVDGQVEHIHSRAREVSDVTGAGDSVTAGLAVGLVEGASMVEAARLATAVAAVAVERRGTYAVRRSDLGALDLLDLLDRPS